VDKNCTSCHNDPPDGGSRPNRDGSHGVHDALAKVSGQCLVCHNGSGTNTAFHYDESGPADVSMLSTYQALNATLSYNADETCSGVRCHGGLRTPKWSTETIDVDTECVKCHERGVSQYSPDSGRHGLHLREGFDCTDCHNAGDPAGDPVEGSVQPLYVSHFVGLDTSGLEGDPGDTIRKFMNYTAGASQPSCTFGRFTRCHGTSEHESPKRW
jgi:predicted CxxxxCH...CXXCH cytochrome family protein